MKRGLSWTQWGIVLLIALAGACILSQVSAQQGTVHTYPDSSLPQAGGSCGNNRSGYISRETGRLLVCDGGTWVTYGTGGEGVYDVLAYGATCGGTDQEGEINAAINAANTAGGGTVYIPCDCTLGVDGQIILKPNVDVVGCDRWSSKIEKQWTGSSWSGSTFVTDDLDATPTKQNNWSVRNLRLDYDAAGCSGQCEGGMFRVYGDEWVIAETTGDWYEDAAFIGGGDDFLITENIWKQEQTAGVVGDDGVRIAVSDHGGLVTNNIVHSGDDCYDTNFTDSGTILVEQTVKGVGFFNNYCDSRLARMYAASAQTDGTGGGQHQDIVIDGLFGEAGSYCITIHDQALDQCSVAGVPHACCTGFRAGASCTNLTSKDQISNIRISNVRGTCATEGDQSDSTDRGVLVIGATDVTLDNIHITGMDNDGVDIAFAERIALQNSTIDTSTSNSDEFEPGVIVRDNSSAVSIVNNTIRTNDDEDAVYIGGLNVCNGCQVNFNRCILEDSAAVCVYMGQDPVTMIGNTIIPAQGYHVGTHTGSSGAATLTDSAGYFEVDALIGAWVVNITDDSRCEITDNDGSTVTCTLLAKDGTCDTEDCDWDSSDVYKVVNGQGIVANSLGTQSVNMNDFSLAYSTASGNDSIHAVGNIGDDEGGLGWRTRFVGDEANAPQVYITSNRADGGGIIYLRANGDNYTTTSGRVFELEAMAQDDDIAEINFATNGALDEGVIRFWIQPTGGNTQSTFEFLANGDLVFEGDTVDGSETTLRTDATSDTVITFPAGGNNGEAFLFIGAGADPSANCTRGEVYMDTNTSSDTNCTTTFNNALCVCTATGTPGTWTGQ